MTRRFSFVLLAIVLGTAGASAQTPQTALRLITPQAPSTLNPYLSGGIKELDAATLVLEPLARYDEDGEIIPWLATQVPTVNNGGISDDLTTITWTLKPDLKWSDGTSVTSEDVAFTYAYCTHPDVGCARSTRFDQVAEITTPDPQTIVIRFEGPMPNPYGPFVSSEAPILQAAQFEDCIGEAAPSCTEANFAPIGTGPFVVEEFRPNDVVMFTRNPEYREADKPAFSEVELKGAGATGGAAQAVLETGEYDYAWQFQLAPDVIADMEEEGHGVSVAAFGSTLESIVLNHTNPDPGLPEGERSVVRPHPFLQHPAVYRALSLAIDRSQLIEVGFGKTGRATCSWIPAPAGYDIDVDGCASQDLDGARALLDEAGVVDTDDDGVRELDGTPLSILYQTATSPVRQDIQALVKNWWEDIGFAVELRNIDPSVFFSGDPGSPDTLQKFHADVQMFAGSFPDPDPQAYLAFALCEEAPSPETQWQGMNIARFCMPEYDALYEELTRTADIAERQAIGRELNRMVVENGMTIPLVHRGRLSARAHDLAGVRMNAWDSELWNIADWYRSGE